MYNKFEQFGLNAYPPEIRGRFNSFITTQFDDSLSVEMQIRSIIKWAKENFDETVNQTNSFIDFINDLIEYMNEFIDTFDTKFQDEILLNLQKWNDDGTLETLINESLDTKYHKMDERLTAELSQKANQVELEVERQRINSLSSLAEGSTTGDVELQDIRIGADGVEYQTAGDSVRTQLRNVDKAFGRRFISPPFITGYMIHSTGEQRPSEPYQISEPLLLKKGETIVTKAGGTEGVITIISRPNPFSELNDVIQTSSTNNISEYSYTAPSDEHIVICSRITDYQYTYIVDTNKKANINSDMLSAMVKPVDVTVNKEVGYYFNPVGGNASNPNYFKTDVISLEPNEIISFYARGTDVAVSILSEVDDEGNYIRTLILSEDSNPKLFHYGTNQRMNVVISCATDVPFYIEKLKLNDVFFPEVDKKEDEDYTPLFDNAVFIGDSITEGMFGDYPSGERVRDFSYPKAIGKLTQWTIENLGASGTNPTSWWNEHSETDFTPYDVAFLMFGRNQSFENPEDEVNYKNIIAKLKADNPNITIFILSLAPAINNNEVPLNEIIKQIATDTDLPYLDIFTDSKMDYTKSELYRTGDGVHYNKLGYTILANDVLREMNSYIERNPNDFKDLFVPIKQ